jgi:hypothetical protein
MHIRVIANSCCRSQAEVCVLVNLLALQRTIISSMQGTLTAYTHTHTHARTNTHELTRCQSLEVMSDEGGVAGTGAVLGRRVYLPSVRTHTHTAAATMRRSLTLASNKSLSPVEEAPAPPQPPQLQPQWYSHGAADDQCTGTVRFRVSHTAGRGIETAAGVDYTQHQHRRRGAGSWTKTRSRPPTPPDPPSGHTRAHTLEQPHALNRHDRTHAHTHARTRGPSHTHTHTGRTARSRTPSRGERAAWMDGQNSHTHMRSQTLSEGACAERDTLTLSADDSDVAVSAQPHTHTDGAGDDDMSELAAGITGYIRARYTTETFCI